MSAPNSTPRLPMPALTTPGDHISPTVDAEQSPRGKRKGSQEPSSSPAAKRHRIGSSSVSATIATTQEKPRSGHKTRRKSEYKNPHLAHLAPALEGPRKFPRTKAAAEKAAKDARERNPTQWKNQLEVHTENKQIGGRVEENDSEEEDGVEFEDVPPPDQPLTSPSTMTSDKDGGNEEEKKRKAAELLENAAKCEDDLLAGFWKRPESDAGSTTVASLASTSAVPEPSAPSKPPIKSRGRKPKKSELNNGCLAGDPRLKAFQEEQETMCAASAKRHPNRNQEVEAQQAAAAAVAASPEIPPREDGGTSSENPETAEDPETSGSEPPLDQQQLQQPSVPSTSVEVITINDDDEEDSSPNLEPVPEVITIVDDDQDNPPPLAPIAEAPLGAVVSPAVAAPTPAASVRRMTPQSSPGSSDIDSVVRGSPFPQIQGNQYQSRFQRQQQHQQQHHQHAQQNLQGQPQQNQQQQGPRINPAEKVKQQLRYLQTLAMTPGPNQMEARARFSQYTARLRQALGRPPRPPSGGGNAGPAAAVAATAAPAAGPHNIAASQANAAWSPAQQMVMPQQHRQHYHQQQQSQQQVQQQAQQQSPKQDQGRTYLDRWQHAVRRRPVQLNIPSPQPAPLHNGAAIDINHNNKNNTRAPFDPALLPASTSLLPQQYWRQEQQLQQPQPQEPQQQLQQVVNVQWQQQQLQLQLQQWQPQAIKRQQAQQPQALQPQQQWQPPIMQQQPPAGPVGAVGATSPLNQAARQSWASWLRRA